VITIFITVVEYNLSQMKEKKVMDDDPNTAADKKRRLLTNNKKNVASKRARPATPLSDITSSVNNLTQTSQSKTPGHANTHTPPSQLKSFNKKSEAYLPVLSESGNWCENSQPSPNCTPIHLLPKNINVEPLRVPNLFGVEKKKGQTSAKKARSKSTSTEFAINMPKIQLTSQYHSAKNTQLPTYNHSIVNSTHTLKRKVTGFTPLENIQNLPPHYPLSKEIRGAHKSGNLLENIQPPTLCAAFDKLQYKHNSQTVSDAYYCSSQEKYLHTSAVKPTLSEFPINMPNIQCNSQYHVTNHTQFSNLYSNILDSTQTVRRNVPGLNLMNKFDETIQPVNISTISPKAGKKRNDVCTETSINKKCSQKEVLDSIADPVQSKKTKFSGLSHSTETNTTKIPPGKTSRISTSKKTRGQPSDVKNTSPKLQQKGKSSSCSHVPRKRTVECSVKQNNPRSKKQLNPKSNIPSMSQPVEKILTNLLASLDATHPSVSSSSQDIHRNPTQSPNATPQPPVTDQQCSGSGPQVQLKRKQIATDSEYFETMSKTLQQTTQENDNINEDSTDSDSEGTDHIETDSDSESDIDIQYEDETDLQGKSKFSFNVNAIILLYH
jgi:hypothetical protein